MAIVVSALWIIFPPQLFFFLKFYSNGDIDPCTQNVLQSQGTSTFDLNHRWRKSPCNFGNQCHLHHLLLVIIVKRHCQVNH